MDIQRLSDELSFLIESEPSLTSGAQIESTDRLCNKILKWLNMVLLHTCAFIPNITEKNAPNVALGHPLSIWLFEYADTIDKLCILGMQMTKEFEDIPIPLIRLPQLTARYRKFLLPIVEKFNKDSIEEMKEAMPEYLKLREKEEKE